MSSATGILRQLFASYNGRSAVTWVLDKGGRGRGWAIGFFSKDGYYHTTPLVHRKYFLEAFSSTVLVLPVVHDHAGRCTRQCARSTCARTASVWGNHNAIAIDWYIATADERAARA